MANNTRLYLTKEADNKRTLVPESSADDGLVTAGNAESGIEKVIEQQNLSPEKQEKNNKRKNQL